MKARLCLLLCVVTAYGLSYAQVKLASPNGKIDVRFDVDKVGRMTYQVGMNSKKIILPSTMGLEGRDGINLSDGFRILKVQRKTVNTSWTQPWGENKLIKEHYNEAAVVMKNRQGVQLTARFRAFDDGVGYRYEYNVPKVDSLFVMNENTAFHFAEDARSWSIAANFDTYELPYRDERLSKIKDANTPITLRFDDGIYASIHEAALTDYPEMTLVNKGGLTFQANLAPWPDGVKARFKGGRFRTPWRTIQLSNDAVGLINSALILNLNDPCALPDTKWIKPLKYVGIWWGMHLGIETWAMDERHGATTANALKYIDFAAANNIQGVVYEGWNAGWESW